MKHQHLIIFEECKYVEGYAQGLMYDLARSENSNYLPNSFGELLSKLKKENLYQVYKFFNKDSEIIKGYIDFIIKNEYGIIVDKYLSKRMGELPKKYDTPSYIENAHVILNIFEISKFKHIINLLNQIGCTAIEVRLLSYSKEDIVTLLELFDNTIFETIIFVISYTNEITKINLETLVGKNNRLKLIYVFNSPENREKERVLFISKNVDLLKDNGVVNKFTFSINTRTFIEAQNHHSYFNKKIFIDLNGEIKNSQESDEIYGNIFSIKTSKELINIIETSKFKQFWLVKKDETNICSDCEHRFMCLDNRTPYQRENKQWYHKIECKYNPYIARWEGEEGYLTLVECGVISNEKGFSVDHEKIAKINSVLWFEEEGTE